ncbi:hypothetical protein [Pseudomonas defluvii]|uniref:hypothetical protein n=1 Tax=Pseudomonas defluvii TaxID=1876757 RepID=UPI003906800C
MLKPTLPLVMIAVAIALGGSSCHDYGNDDGANDRQNPSSVDTGSNRSGYQLIPRQQLEPRIQSLPRR